MRNKNDIMNQPLLEEEYEEIRLKLLMTRYAELEGRQLFEENEELSKDPFYRPAEGSTQKFIRRLKWHFFLHDFKKMISLPFSHTFKKASFAFFIFIFLTSVVLSVDAMRVKVMNFVITIKDEFTEIQFRDEEQQLQLEWKDGFAPTYVPQGYLVVNISSNENHKSIEYANTDDNGHILFRQSSENIGINVDTENAEEVKPLKVQGREGLLVKKGEMITIFWQDDSRLFLILGNGSNLNKDELVRMAESVSVVK